MRHIITKAEKTSTRFLSIKPGVRNKNSIAAFIRLGFRHIWTVELVRELKTEPGIKWIHGLKIHDNELKY